MGLALVLCFAGVEMLIMDLYKIPIAASLAAVATLLAGSVAASLLWPQPEPLPRPAAAAAGE